jgi:hypothetical protein
MLPLTAESRSKYDAMKSLTNRNIGGVDVLLNSMREKFIIDPKLFSIPPKNVDIMRDEFLQRDRELNYNRSTKLQQDLLEMNYTKSIKLDVDNNFIVVNFIYDKMSIEYMAVILHALNTFCFMMPYNYDGLTIDVCLDCNHRKIITKPVDYNRQCMESAAFTVAGATNRYYKSIFLTKREEIIKLLFHEMIHYVGLDEILVDFKNDINWCVNRRINISEAYTEFLSVIMYAAYISLHCGVDFHDLLNQEINYSFYLSASILKYNGYTSTTYMNFFRGIGDKHECPIQIWEYVLLRTIFMNNLEKLAGVYKIDHDNIKILMSTLKDKSFFDVLKKFMDYDELDHIGYVLVDIDWTKI